MAPNPALNAYRVPSVLRDLVLVDMLELTGSTTVAARLLNLSQPTVSRRYRRLAAELGLRPDHRRQPGSRFADADWFRLLRHGANSHRLACGVLRLGGPSAIGEFLLPWWRVEWIPLPARTLLHWEDLLEHHLLDGVVFNSAFLPSLRDNNLRPFQLSATDPALWLRCRNDPCVQAIAQQLPQAPS